MKNRQNYCSELVREERSIAAAPLQRQQDVMTSLAANSSQSTPRSWRAAANQRPSKIVIRCAANASAGSLLSIEEYPSYNAEKSVGQW